MRPEETKKPQLREGVRAKFIDRWANRYCEKLRTEGKGAALDWGTKFFNAEDIEAIASRAREILQGHV